jgi:general secretion pathway protein K
VIAERPWPLSLPKSQSGVALLQVLLISAMISILAIQFTKTAQYQLEMASEVDKRVRAELKAKSVLNEVLFLQLSETITPNHIHTSLVTLPPKSSLNRYGTPIVWSDGVIVRIQDLNGLLPQMFVDHSLWKPALHGLNFGEEEVKNYLGIWGDMQDSDLISWDTAREEPVRLPNGQPYINGFAQNDKLIKWLFSDKPDVLFVLMKISDINAHYETNLLNAPDELLSVLLEPVVAEEFVTARRSGNLFPHDLNSILPAVYQSPNLSSYQSGDLKISVHVDMAHSSWVESQVISLALGSKPPFQVRLRE